MHILIAGAGIAGLTAAVALRRHGIEATVLEQAHEIREIFQRVSKSAFEESKLHTSLGTTTMAFETR